MEIQIALCKGAIFKGKDMPGMPNDTAITCATSGQRILTKGRITQGVFHSQIKINPLYYPLHFDEFAL